MLITSIGFYWTRCKSELRKLEPTKKFFLLLIFLNCAQCAENCVQGRAKKTQNKHHAVYSGFCVVALAALHVGFGPSARPKATTLYVYNIVAFLVACLLNRWQRASSASCLQQKTRGLTTPRSSKLPSPNISDVIAAEQHLRCHRRWALRQHSSKTLCPGIADPIVRLRSRCASAGHCASTLASLSASAALAYLNLSSGGGKGQICPFQKFS